MKPTDIGKNRTGAALSPVQVKEAIEGAREGVRHPSVDVSEVEKERVSFSADADPLGTMPPPATVKGAAKAVLQIAKGKNPTAFLDLLGARLAFERTGTRLYEALIVKFDAGHPHEGGPRREQLEHLRDEELAHFALLTRALKQLGADPTAVTPAADVHAVASSGIVQILADPRTTLSQALDVILTAELADNDAWAMLADYADQLGLDELAESFRTALAEESEHLRLVRGWVNAAFAGQLGIEPTRPREREAPSHVNA
jgi:rubrerythrin